MDVRDRLEYVSYDHIYQAIADMKDKFLPTAIIKKGAYIDRVRVHKKLTGIYYKQEDVSYIHDKEFIRNHQSTRSLSTQQNNQANWRTRFTAYLYPRRPCIKIRKTLK